MTTLRKDCEGGWNSHNVEAISFPHSRPQTRKTFLCLFTGKKGERRFKTRNYLSALKRRTFFFVSPRRADCLRYEAPRPGNMIKASQARVSHNIENRAQRVFTLSVIKAEEESFWHSFRLSLRLRRERFSLLFVLSDNKKREKMRAI